MKLSVIIYKIKLYMKSPINIFISFSAAFFYVWIAIKMKFVIFNMIGIYSLIILFLDIVFSAFIILNYLYLIISFYRISKKEEYLHHPFDISKSLWIKTLAEISDLLSAVFFVLVSFMVIVFILFSPSNIIILIYENRFLYDKTLPTLLYFLTIFIYDIIILPVFSLLKSIYLSRIVNTITSENIRFYEKKLINSKKRDAYKYISLIEYIEKNTEDFLNSKKYKLVPIFSYSFNFISILISTIVSVKDLL